MFFVQWVLSAAMVLLGQYCSEEREQSCRTLFILKIVKNGGAERAAARLKPKAKVSDEIGGINKSSTQHLLETKVVTIQKGMLCLKRVWEKEQIRKKLRGTSNIY